MKINKILFERYKCFKNETEIKDIKPINIIIGKNNIGKSSILDIIEMINNPELFDKNGNIKICIEKFLTDNELQKVFLPNTSGGIIGGNHYEFGKKFINKNFRFELYSTRGSSYIQGEVKKSFKTRKVTNLQNVCPEFDARLNNYWEELSKKISYNTKRVKRICAERNVYPEFETPSMNIDPYGNGITTIVNNYLNKVNYDEDKVRNELLGKLNEIMGNDANFTEIITQQIENNKDESKWEIFLREQEKGRIALSQSGSGLKTILMILVNTILLPDIEKSELSEYIFLFEELENNLHPSLERRVLKYLEEISHKGATIFLTTHSSTVLDSFQNNDNVQIYHVFKENNEVKIKKLDNILGKKGCLDDLGIKASDILQSNGIIWVEGPSDRIYINKWIELWSNGKYKEGMNYQCVFYGGRLLSNTTFEEENLDNLINLMNVNKNSIILIDSDKRSAKARINDTKKRIQKECEEKEQLCWITKGKEIENYVPKQIIESFFEKEIDDNFGEYETIDTFLNKYNVNEGEKFKISKITYAKKYSEKMTLSNMQTVLDLNENMKKVIAEIEKWNNI